MCSQTKVLHILLASEPVPLPTSQHIANEFITDLPDSGEHDHYIKYWLVLQVIIPLHVTWPTYNLQNSQTYYPPRVQVLCYIWGYCQWRWHPMAPNVSQGYGLVSWLNLSLHHTTFKPMVGWIGPTRKLDVSCRLFHSTSYGLSMPRIPYILLLQIWKCSSVCLVTSHPCSCGMLLSEMCPPYTTGLSVGSKCRRVHSNLWNKRPNEPHTTMVLGSSNHTFSRLVIQLMIGLINRHN